MLTFVKFKNFSLEVACTTSTFRKFDVKNFKNLIASIYIIHNSEIKLQK